MRLTEKEKSAIVRTISSFDSNALIYLFGSRCDDKKRGGDIDIAVLSSIIDRKTISNIRLKLYELIGEQKIDIVSGAYPDSTFFKMAVETGILLHGKSKPGNITAEPKKP